MTKRIISFLLSAVMIFGVCAATAPQVSAAGSLTTSEECIALIKEYEGFTPKPVFDYSQYSVGYGSSCQKGDYPNGITREQADKLLRKDLKTPETQVRNFAKKYGLNFSQNQFDALVSFTYNLGGSWMKEKSVFRDAVINGAKGNDFIFAITMWSSAGGALNNGLVQRRLSEANLYLNGKYAKNPPANYSYVLFNNNITDPDNIVRVQGYDVNSPDLVRAIPSKNGYSLLGWYTEANGGEWIPALTKSHAGKTLYAHWQKGTGDPEKGVAANYKRILNEETIVRDKVGGKIMKRLPKGTTVTVTADYLDSAGLRWGKISDGWITLSNAGLAGSEYSGVKLMDPVKVVVNANGVNIRTGPGTSYLSVSKAYKNETLTITRVYKGINYLWGEFTGGWICLDYTNYDDVIANKDTGAEEVTATGVIVKTDKLNVRNRPGTSGTSVVGSYKRGEVVTITAQQKVGTTTWGRTSKGWISLYYVELTGVTPDDNGGSDGNLPGDDSEYEGDVVAVGTVVDCNSLRIRAGAGTKYDQVGSLARGTKVEIYQIATVGSQLWGRINKGWVSMNYIKLTGTTPGSGGTPTPAPDDNDTPQQPEQTEKVNKTGVIIGTNQLRVRATPGTQGKQVGTYNKGDKVVILETTKVGTATWGRTEKGWIHMHYVRLSTTEVAEGSIVRTVTANLNIRAGAGTSYAAIGKYPKGTQVVITSQTKVGSTTWGRTDKGWISMDYVK